MVLRNREISDNIQPPDITVQKNSLAKVISSPFPIARGDFHKRLPKASANYSNDEYI